MALSFAIARCPPAETEDHMTKRDSDAIRADLMADHVPYEIAMMRHTHEGVGRVPQGTCRNAYIESFAIHARALSCFFHGKHGADAKHYTENYSPFANLPGQRVPERLTDKLN